MGLVLTPSERMSDSFDRPGCPDRNDMSLAMKVVVALVAAFLFVGAALGFLAAINYFWCHPLHLGQKPIDQKQIETREALVLAPALEEIGIHGQVQVDYNTMYLTINRDERDARTVNLARLVFQRWGGIYARDHPGTRRSCTRIVVLDPSGAILLDEDDSQFMNL